MERLTDEQRQFAEKHHKLIHKYLHKTGLPYDNFYDAAALGYLRAVQNYLTQPKLQEYQFATIAFNCMRANVGGALRQERAALDTVSLDQPVSGDFLRMLRHETVPSDSRRVDDSILELLVEEEYLSQLTPLQQKIARLSYAGYPRKMIASTCGISTNAMYRNLDQMKNLLCRMLPNIAA